MATTERETMAGCSTIFLGYFGDGEFGATGSGELGVS